MTALYGGSRLGRQELDGEVIDDVPNALWNWAMIEAARIDVAPEMDRLILAVDPPVTSGENADSCGLILAGQCLLAERRHAFVLADLTVQGASPLQWAQRILRICREYPVDRVVIEVNQGGDLVQTLLRQLDFHLPIRQVRAHKSKIARAEPVAALYEQGLVRHVGAFPALEDEMTQFNGAPSAKSPDRLDALVWALTELMINRPPSVPTVRSL